MLWVYGSVFEPFATLADVDVIAQVVLPAVGATLWVGWFVRRQMGLPRQSAGVVDALVAAVFVGVCIMTVEFYLSDLRGCSALPWPRR